MESRSVIQKRESQKVWQAFNTLGSEMRAWQDENSKERTKHEMHVELDPIMDDKIESELELINTKIGKQMSAFF